MKVLVTGAEGFVGSALCEALRHSGCIVRKALRHAGGCGGADDELVEVGDIGKKPKWDAAVAGVDAVVHLAARTHILKEISRDPESEFRRVNVEATRTLAEAARCAGVRRFVFVSTIQVLGNATADSPFCADDSPRPQGPYARSKLEAERALIAAAAESAMETVILRPPLIYGPGVKGNFLRLMRLVDRGLPLPFGRLRNQRSLLGVRNFADAIVVSLRHPAAAGGTFLLCDGEDLSTAELAARLAAACGRRARLLPVPERVLRVLLRAAGGERLVERLAGSLCVDGRGFRERLGWTPPVSVEAGLRETACWYRRQHQEGCQ